MKMRLKMVIGVLAAASLIMLAGCGKNTQTAPAQDNSQAGQRIEEAEYPNRILDGLDDPRLQKTVFAVGRGQTRPGGDFVLAKRSADADADRRIASFFQQHIGAIYEEYRAQTGSSVESHIQDAMVVRLNQRISGTTELARYTTRTTAPDGTIEVFVIKYIVGQELLNAMNDIANELNNEAVRQRAEERIDRVRQMMDRGDALRAM